MLVDNEPREVIQKLAEQVKDAGKSMTERRDALKLICEIRKEPYQHVPDDDLAFVVGAMVYWPVGLKGLSLASAMEALSEGKARRGMDQRRK